MIIGAMKCGTSALHDMLAEHPEASMAQVKETNFFIGAAAPVRDDPDSWWRDGLWHRGLGWYASLFDAQAPVRGESSPGYTSPDHREAPERMARVLPDAQLVYLVRDPADRAFSQYRHHQRDGAETRPPEEALLDPESQYLARSRYYAQLRPFLERFRRDQILVVVQERLRDRPDAELSRIHAHLGLTPRAASAQGGGGAPRSRDSLLPAPLRAHIYEAVSGDVARLRAEIDDPLPEWGC